MVRIVVIVCCLTGCLAISAKNKPTTGASVAAASAGVAIAGASLAGAAYASDSANAKQSAATVGTSVIPMAAIYLGEEPDEPSTPGGIYSNMLGGLGNSFGASLLFVAPLVAAIQTGDADDDSANAAAYGAAGGIFLGTVTSVFLGSRLPKWGRVVVGALVTGSMTTLGYQLAK